MKGKRESVGSLKWHRKGEKMRRKKIGNIFHLARITKARHKLKFRDFFSCLRSLECGAHKTLRWENEKNSLLPFYCSFFTFCFDFLFPPVASPRRLNDSKVKEISIAKEKNLMIFLCLRWLFFSPPQPPPSHSRPFSSAAKPRWETLKVSHREKIQLKTRLVASDGVRAIKCDTISIRRRSSVG